MNNNRSQTNIERAAAFFNHPERIRLLDALYHKYMKLGHIGGQVTLKDATAEERREIASFLNKRISSERDIIVKLATFQQALDESSFACDLSDLLRALFPERPHTTNPQRREARTLAHERFSADLQTLAAAQPHGSRAQRWLLQGSHGLHALFSHYKNEPPIQQEQLLATLTTICLALNQLPAPHTFERLALFAQRISGDPHYLDFNTFSGRLFFHALSDLAHLEQHTITESDEEDLNAPEILLDGQQQVSSTINTLEQQQEHAPSPPQDHLRLLLYYDAGLLLDTLSSTVAVCNLAHTTDATGTLDSLIEHAGSRILVLPLRQLLVWQQLRPTSTAVYLFENPQVFEEVVDALLDAYRSANTATLPTLICTSGWPSIATIRLLNLLTESSPHITLHYSGDFDLQGLRIASHLLARYPNHCQLWHFDPDSYLATLHERNAAFTPQEIKILQKLPDIFTPLVSTMLEQGRKAYQEGITHLLIADISGNVV